MFPFARVPFGVPIFDPQPCYRLLVPGVLWLTTLRFIGSQVCAPRLVEPTRGWLQKWGWSQRVRLGQSKHTEILVDPQKPSK